MTNGRLDYSQTFIYDLHWDASEIKKIENLYSIHSREIILPAFLFSLSRYQRTFFMPFFFKANEEAERVLDNLLCSDGMEHLDEKLKEEFKRNFYIDIQLLGSKISRKTLAMKDIVLSPDQIRNVRFVRGDLYVTVSD